MSQSMGLFDTVNNSSSQPLAERLRPKDFSGFVGQTKVVGPQSLVRRLLDSGQVLPSLILWGPPGSGKTTFARLIIDQAKARSIPLSAVDTGAKQIREVGQEARDFRLQHNRATLVFIDEIHRLNRSQQDVLLPFVEQGDFSLIGATTENPSYHLNAALLSRCRVLPFSQLSEVELKVLLDRACEKVGKSSLQLLATEAQDQLCLMAQGDARQLLGLLEQVLNQDIEPEGFPLDKDNLNELVTASPMYYDRAGDEHYDCISAFIKSIRGSDPDAAIYYLARMLAGGEDPLFVARRLVISASEDVGNADPRALTLAVSGLQAVELVGLPEAAINLAQVTTYLASAPKSNRSYKALRQAQKLVKDTGRPPIPKSLRSSQTKLSRQLGHGEGYRYSHDGPKGYLKQSFLPEKLASIQLYEPADRGFEKNILKYLEWMKS